MNPWFPKTSIGKNQRPIPRRYIGRFLDVQKVEDIVVTWNRIRDRRVIRQIKRRIPKFDGAVVGKNFQRRVVVRLLRHLGLEWRWRLRMRLEARPPAQLREKSLLGASRARFTFDSANKNAYYLMNRAYVQGMYWAFDHLSAFPFRIKIRKKK